MGNESKFLEELQLLDSEHVPESVKFAEKAPDGTYQARLDVCRVGKSKNGRLQTHMKFEIVHGEHEGRTIDKWAGMESSDQLDFLTKDIWNLAGDKFPFKWTEVEKVYEKLLDTIAQVVTKTDEKSGIQNVFIQRKITEAKPSPNKPKEANKSVDDDIPF